ncbi:MAG: hypothetical protein IJ716_04615 [Lachnospiraceae bacterium]|nr:hypothetical protein [Lachnospiraceae bacterium]
MGIKIEYPTEDEIKVQKEKILRVALERKTVSRPDFQILFYNCRLILAVGILLYLLLLYFCLMIRGRGNEGYWVLMMYPFTYFVIYFLSILAEEQSEVVELKQSMKYSFVYVISMRMLYTNVMAVFLNLIMIGILHSALAAHAWSLAAAGTTADIFLALASLTIYEKTGSAKISGVLFLGWIVGCIWLLLFGQNLYHLLIEVVPLAVHLAVAAFSFLTWFEYMRKVEHKNAYNF